MNPVNATALYVSACRSVLQCDPRDSQSVAELCKLLPFFRQSLSCLVCGNLLQDPIAPTNSTCQHYVCKGCKGQKMVMKPSCSWCKDYEQFEENKQLGILVECYRKLCEYMAGSPLLSQIASEGSPEVLALLKEGFPPTASAAEESQGAAPVALSHSPLPSTSEHQGDHILPEPPVQPQEPVPDVVAGAPNVNGMYGCNGLSMEELTSVAAASPGSMAPAADGRELKPEGFPDGMPVCRAAASEELCSDGIDICSFGEDIKPSGDSLLLTVEEVLRTLEPDTAVEDVLPSGLEPSGDLSRPFTDTRQPSLPLDPGLFASRHPALPPPPPPSGISCSAATPKAARLNRKRSRSESDSEKIQPLPISSIIQGPPLAAAAPVSVKREPSKVLAQPVAAVPNGGPPKVSKTLLVSNKGIKKNPDHGPKKAYTKVKQGVPKTKDKTKDRLPGANLIPGSPTKVVYKKPQEKKGCKCGRATQNPSVLTCRGQRCPCYSNRKACLDCICRGCQNSYMANGEKKLEAFAVPEKALEQTRLTLGINVTSIAVRSAGTSSGVLNMAAGSPVPSFLAASPHEDKGYDETLDMRFDC
ncbi:E3 ubiquitin-protein ligase MSL2-like [Brienomyrus brachyistius]|uniref:E3 ubiquitin-protein ligase MSL2-like n=1 Tax=Brienomyrus brachyistius TaxID=42636 RepID=UPI0020B1AE9E|nr:E3 ubiquitin-protein ligase MSL2-like [Brienomyrus brachyistius]